MPTYEWTAGFGRDLRALGAADPALVQRFREAVQQFIDDLDAHREFSKGLRVKAVQSAPGIMEMTFAPDGRATWQFGPEQRPGVRHIIWRRIGHHDIYGRP
jgi:hypothetical protein